MLISKEPTVAGRVAAHVADLEDELALLKQLDHPNIVRYLVSSYPGISMHRQYAYAQMLSHAQVSQQAFWHEHRRSALCQACYCAPVLGLTGAFAARRCLHCLNANFVCLDVYLQCLNASLLALPHLLTTYSILVWLLT